MEIEAQVIQPEQNQNDKVLSSGWEIYQAYVMPPEEWKNIPEAPPNFLNELVAGLRDMLGWQREKVYSFMKDVETPEDVKKKYGDEAWKFYLQELKGLALNSLTLGLYPAPEETVLPESSLGKVGFTVARGLQDFAIITAQSALLEALTFGTATPVILSRLFKAGSLVERLATFKMLPKTSKLIAEGLPLAKQMLRAGTSLGTVGFLQTLVNANEVTNNIWEALKDAGEAAIHDGLFGAGFPMIGKFNSVAKRMILANALGNMLGFFFTGKADISTIWHYLATSDVSEEDFYQALYNTALNTFFGALAGKYDNIAKESLEVIENVEKSRELTKKPEIKFKEEKQKVVEEIKQKDEVALDTESLSLFGKEDKGQEVIKEVVREIEQTNYQFKHSKAMKEFIEEGKFKKALLIDDSLKRTNDLQKFSHSMVGNKIQILNQEGYEAILERGLIGVKHIVDWFAGTGKMTYNIVKYLPELAEGKEFILNEKEPHRKAVLEHLFTEDKREKFLKAIEKVYQEAGQKAIELVKKYQKDLLDIKKRKVAKEKLSEEWAAYIKNKIKFLGKKETKYDVKKTAWYFLAQNNMFSGRMLDAADKYISGIELVQKGKGERQRAYVSFRKLLAINPENPDKAQKEIQKRIQKVKDSIINAPYLKKSQFLGQKAWATFKDLPENSFVIFDSAYIEEEAGKGIATYGVDNEEQYITFEDYTKHFEKDIMPYINSKDIKIVVHNNYTPELADWFAERGFLVYKTFRKSNRRTVPELIAINFDIQGRILKIGKGIDNTQYLWAGVPLPLLGNLIETSKIYLGKLFEQVAADVKGTGAKAFIFWISNPFHLEYVSGHPLVKEFAKKMKSAEFEIEGRIANKVKKIEGLKDFVLEEQDRLNKEAWEDLNAILWDANINNEDPFSEQFQAKWEEFQKKHGVEAYQRAREITQKIKELFREYYKQEMAIREGQVRRLKDKVDEETLSMFMHIKDLEKDFFKQRKFYLPHVRKKGNISIAVIKDDKTIHYEEITDPSIYVLGGRSILAERKVKELKQKFGKDVKINVYKKKEYDVADLWEGFTNLVDILERTDIPGEEKKKILQGAIEFLKTQSFRSHFKRRKDWEITGYIKDFGEAIRIYHAQITSHWWKYFWTEHLPELEKIAKKDAVLWKNFERWREQLMYNKDWRDKLVAMTRTFAFMKYLALNLKNGFVQIMQNATFTPFFLAREIKNLKKVSDEKAFSLAYGYVLKAIEEYFSGSWEKDEVKRQIIEELIARKVLDSQQTAYFTGKSALLGRAWTKFQQIMGFIMNKTERFNRFVSAIAYINATKPKEANTEAIYLTREFVFLANGKYGDMETPFILQGKDNLKYFFRAGYTFKTYNTQMLLGLYRLFKENEYRLLLYSLGILGIVGGLQVLPFYYTSKQIYEAITDRSFDLDVLNWIGSVDYWGLLEKGIFTKVGIDLSGSLAIETPTDTILRGLHGEKNLFDVVGEFAFGIPYTIISDLQKSFEELEKGNWEKALYYGLPLAFLRYPFKALGERFKGITTDGNLIITDIDGNPLKPSEAEFILQAVGFTPARISEFKGLYFAYKGLLNRYQRARKTLYTRYRNAVLKHDVEGMIEAGNEMVKLNKKILQVNRDYRIAIPFASIDKVKTINKQVDFLNILRYNLGK